MIFSLRVPDELEARLREVAQRRYISLNSLILQVLADSPLLQGEEVPSVAREPGKLFSEAEALAIAKSPVVAASVAPAKPSKAAGKAHMAKVRLERRGK
jgi:predicted transcriptional regulator